MVRTGAAPRLLTAGVLSCLVVACGSGSGPQSAGQGVGPGDSATIAFVPRSSGPLEQRMLAVATALAGGQSFRLRAFLPASGTLIEQAQALGEALAARPRAIVLDPIDYSALFPYLRAAHDAGTPVVLLQTPRDLRNATFVASFVAPEQRGLDAATASALVGLIGSQRVPTIAFLSTTPPAGTAGATFAGLSRDLRRLRPTARLTAVPLDGAGASTARERLRTLLTAEPPPSAVVSIDALSTGYLAAAVAGVRRRPAVVVTTVDGQSSALLSQSLADVVVGADMCEATRSAMRAAAAAARNEPAGIEPAPTVTPRTYSRAATLDACA